MRNNKFHQHLDTCAHCRENPFRLCLLGAAELQNAATEDLHEWEAQLAEDLREESGERMRSINLKPTP